VLTVKGNQANLYEDLTIYFRDPHTVIAPFERDSTLDLRRGRTELRSIEVSCGMNDYLAPAWPLVSQVARLTRTVTVRKTGKTTKAGGLPHHRPHSHPGQSSSSPRSGAGSLEHRERFALCARCLLWGRPFPLAHWLVSSHYGRVAQSGHHPYSSQRLLSDCRFSTALRLSSAPSFLSPSSPKEVCPAIVHRPWIPPCL